MRVLLIAEACNPKWASVPLVGWNWYKALREQVDVTLVTQVRNRDAVLYHGSSPDKVVFIDSEKVARPFHRVGHVLTLGRGLGWTTKQAMMWLPYLYFEKLVYHRFQRDLGAGRYHIIHRLTPLSPTYASPLASWVDTPFVVGPLNGGLPWPKRTTKTRLAEMEFLSYMRAAYRWLPYVRATYRRAAAVIAGSRHTQTEVEEAFGVHCHYIPENGIDPARFSPDGRIPPSEVWPFRILFVGRLVPYKGAEVVLEAFAASPLLRTQAEVVIAGDGPRRPQLERLADALRIADRVCFAGQVAQTRLADFFRTASVLAFPSIREFGGAVVLEAMACGLPCIVAGYGGPSEFVTPETGVALSVANRGTRITELRAALEGFARARERLNVMSAACVRRIQESFLWDRKAESVRDIYGSARDGRPSNRVSHVRMRA